MKLTVSSTVPARQLTAVTGTQVHLPDRDGLVHLQFRRFAGCPVCNLHLRSFTRRHGDLLAAGVREAVVFHSPAAELRPHADGLPFPVIADPSKRLYTEFGVESARRALLDPRAWPAIAKGILASSWGIVRHRRPAPSLRPHGGRFGLPADFLIASDGRILAVKYGEHADDHWSVDQLLDLARWERQAAASPSGEPGDRRRSGSGRQRGAAGAG